MSHEDYLEPNELDKMREQFNESPQRENNTLGAAPLTTLETMDYCTVKLPKPVLWALLYLLIGVAIGAFCYSVLTLPKEQIVTPATETLTDFVARESQSLTADERKKLIAAAGMVLAQQFETPSALREEFAFQRDRAGLHDSPGFNAFWGKWATKVTEMQIEDSVEAMQDVYSQLLHGLQAVKSYIDISGESVEGNDVAPSIINKASIFAADADEPISPGFSRQRLRQRLFRSRVIL